MWKGLIFIVASCTRPPTADEVVGWCLCIAGMCSYFPQYYSLIKSKQAKGISELSLFLLNIGSACLVVNSIILNWYKWQCYNKCGFWLCTANLLPFWQILVGWIMVVPLYLIFIRFKRLNSERHCAYDLAFVLTYALFIIIVLAIGLSEKFTEGDSKPFFLGLSYFMGIASAVFFCVVWIPQIYKLIKTKNQGNLSLVMFLIQAPGNVVIIVFQAVLFRQNWSTWFTYVVVFVEQMTIEHLVAVAQ